MANIHTTDEQLGLFGPDDPYYYTTDNRPLRKLQENIVAINDQLEDVAESDCEVIEFIVESPSAETSVCGGYMVREDGDIIRVVMSHGTAGASGQHVADINKNGTTIFTNQGHRPTLVFNDADGVDETLSGEIDVSAVLAGDIISCDLDEVQTGSPRWVRVTIFIRKSQTYSV